MSLTIIQSNSIFCKSSVDYYRLLYKRIGIKPVIDVPNTDPAQKPIQKRILFSEEFQKPEDLPENVRAILVDFLKTAEIYELQLSYENFDASIF